MEEDFSMEWNMEENFSMEWKIFGMEWKWNGRKLPVWNMEKSSFIPFHIMPCIPYNIHYFCGWVALLNSVLEIGIAVKCVRIPGRG